MDLMDPRRGAEDRMEQLRRNVFIRFAAQRFEKKQVERWFTRGWSPEAAVVKVLEYNVKGVKPRRVDLIDEWDINAYMLPRLEERGYLISERVPSSEGGNPKVYSVSLEFLGFYFLNFWNEVREEVMKAESRVKVITARLVNRHSRVTDGLFVAESLNQISSFDDESGEHALMAFLMTLEQLRATKQNEDPRDDDDLVLELYEDYRKSLSDMAVEGHTCGRSDSWSSCVRCQYEGLLNRARRLL